MSSAQGDPGSSRPLHLNLHSFGISIAFGGGSGAGLRQTVGEVLGPLIEPVLPGQACVEGRIAAYDEAEVLRHVSADAVRLAEVDPLLELFRDGERFWLVDERWGMCEVNLLKRTWRSWVLDEPACDRVRLLESAVLWPMAHLLRGFGVHLMPGAAMGRDGKGVLILSPFELGPELMAMSRGGVGVIGQRWVVLREEGERVALLHLPGRTQEAPPPRLLSAGPMGQPGWVDLAAPPYGTPCHHAYCDLVLLAEPMRRARAEVVPLTTSGAREQLKLAWPMPLLAAGSAGVVGTNQLALKLARSCPVHRVRLSRDGGDLARMLVRGEGRNAA